MERYGIEIKIGKQYYYYIGRRKNKVSMASNPTCTKWYLSKKVAENALKTLNAIYANENGTTCKIVTLDSKGTIR